MAYAAAEGVSWTTRVNLTAAASKSPDPCASCRPIVVREGASLLRGMREEDSLLGVVRGEASVREADLLLCVIRKEAGEEAGDARVRVGCAAKRVTMASALAVEAAS